MCFADFLLLFCKKATVPYGNLLKSYYGVNTVALQFSFQNDYFKLLSSSDSPFASDIQYFAFSVE